jgi:hydrogenase nickel incorporation protein HypA/HybF
VHEASIALAIVDEVCERAKLEDASVERVFVRIGALTGVIPEALAFAWELATHGTLAEGSALCVDRAPLRIFCTRCACERGIDSPVPIPVCPVCGQSSNDITGGRELLVTAMEVRNAPSRGGDPSEHPAQKRYART